MLSSLPDLSYKAKYAALSALYSFTPDFSLIKSSLIKSGQDGVYNKVKAMYEDGAFRNKVFAGLERRGVECVTLASADYPEALRHIPDPPVTLFIKGDRRLLCTRLFSVVGSRHTSTKYLADCRKFVKELSAHFTIVSGSAVGADSAALESADRAISVLAFGQDYFEKTVEPKVVKRIEECGLTVSEHYPTVGAQRYFFPFRNRIIAGLSEGTLVVSAGAKSGALITADYAADFGREVFAFPYNIGVSTGEGCNNLIKHGAYLCQNPLDILGVFGLDLKPSQKIELTEDEQRLYSAISEQGEVFLPALASEWGVQPYTLLPAISSLEIKKLIVRLGGNRYSKV